RDRLLVRRVAAELANAGNRPVDVVRVEVDDRPADPALGLVHGAARLRAIEQVVLHVTPRRLVIPAEQSGPEALGARDIACGQLEVDEIPCHRSSFASTFAGAYAPARQGASVADHEPWTRVRGAPIPAELGLSLERRPGEKSCMNRHEIDTVECVLRLY